MSMELSVAYSNFCSTSILLYIRNKVLSRHQLLASAHFNKHIVDIDALVQRLNECITPKGAIALKRVYLGRLRQIGLWEIRFHELIHAQALPCFEKADAKIRTVCRSRQVFLALAP